MHALPRSDQPRVRQKCDVEEVGKTPGDCWVSWGSHQGRQFTPRTSSANFGRCGELRSRKLPLWPVRWLSWVSDFRIPTAAGLLTLGLPNEEAVVRPLRALPRDGEGCPLTYSNHLMHSSVLCRALPGQRRGCVLLLHNPAWARGCGIYEELCLFKNVYLCMTHMHVCSHVCKSG